jgi:flagellar assembly protein FliH
MNTFSESVSLKAPLRDAVLLSLPAAVQTMDASHQDSWLDGYEQGRIEGENRLGQQLVTQRRELHDLLSGTLESLRQAVPQVVRDTENMMVSLALDVARKLVSDMPVSVEMVEAAVHDALKHVESSAQVTVRLHPADLELLQKVDSPLLASSQSSNDFRFLSSVEVSRGGCLVETRFGTVDARRETKFDLIAKNIQQS